MKLGDSTDDIYNSLPLECFTHGTERVLFAANLLELSISDGTENNLLEQDLDNFSGTLSGSEVESLASSLENLEEELSLVDKELVDAVQNMDLEPRNAKLIPAADEVKEPAATITAIEDQSMWIRCSRCGKKNEIDSNFCGKCGLQIHKVVDIKELVEDAVAATDDIEVAQNIKYHYKRPVFCFGPSGYCFASFSAPSKSIRNMVKFNLTSLTQFKSFIGEQSASLVISGCNDRPWDKTMFSKPGWSFKACYLRDFVAILSEYPQLKLDAGFQRRLQDFFGQIAPKELGQIKILSHQDTVHYSRPEIDKIFHQLVLGNTKDACEISMELGYWDHALIIAKTLDQQYYESVMSSFLDARFKKGHPLRILYLIMTNNEQLALNEIKAIIGSGESLHFVQEIWTIICNFLLRMQSKYSIHVAKIFGQIGDILFDKGDFDEALIVYVLAIIYGLEVGVEEFINRIDYLIVRSIRNLANDTVIFSGYPILYLFANRLQHKISPLVLWRCSFVQLMYSQFLYDSASLSIEMLRSMDAACGHIKKSINQMGFILFEEIDVLKARSGLYTGKDDSAAGSNAKEYRSLKHDSPLNLQGPNLLQAGSMGTNARIDNIPAESSIYSPPLAPSNISNQELKDISSNLKNLQAEVNNDDTDPFAFESSKTPSQNLTNPARSPVSPQSEAPEDGMFVKLKKWLPVAAGKPGDANQKAELGGKTVTKANLGKPSSFRYDSKLKKWVDDNDPSSFEEAPKLAPPPVSQQQPGASNSAPSKSLKNRPKYVDPLNNPNM